MPYPVRDEEETDNPLHPLNAQSSLPGGLAATLTYRYSWIEAVPLHYDKDALPVNWLGVAITNEKGKTTYDGTFATSLPMRADNVPEMAACARARWTIENESFNVLLFNRTQRVDT